MKCNKQLKYSNYVAFRYFHCATVNNSGLVIVIFIVFILVTSFDTLGGYQSRLYVPTMIQKIDDTYYIVDCWNHRIIYSESLDKDISKWNTLTDEEYLGGHTIASDGEVLLIDNTDKNEICVYNIENGKPKKSQTIKGILGRPHYTLYDDKRDRFLVIGSIVGKIYVFENYNGIIDWTGTVELSEISGSYVRSISIIDDQLYTVSGPSKIYVYDIVEDGFALNAEYDVPDQYCGMGSIQKINDYYYVTINNDISSDVSTATILRMRDLRGLSTGEYEEVYDALGFEGQPYFITNFDEKYYCTEISAEGTNGIISFEVSEDDSIFNVKRLWKFDAVEISKERQASKYGTLSVQKVDVVLFAGQSNMAGHGEAEKAPAVVNGYEYRAVSDPNVLYPITEPFGLYENKENGINDTWEEMTVLRKTGGMVSAFANSYYEKTGIPIVGVSCSEGATVIDEWLPGTSRYEDVVARYNSVKDYIESNNDYEIRNVYLVWCQGESDGDNGMSAEEYYSKLKMLSDNMVSNVGIDKFMIVRIGNFGEDEEKYDEIIQAQTDLCEDSEACVLISTRFAEMSVSGLMKDAYHYTQEGYNLVGEEAGENAGYFADTGMEPNLYDYEYKEVYKGH